jgi:hypothetical protein
MARRVPIMVRCCALAMFIGFVSSCVPNASRADDLWASCRIQGIQHIGSRLTPDDEAGGPLPVNTTRGAGVGFALGWLHAEVFGVFASLDWAWSRAEHSHGDIPTRAIQGGVIFVLSDGAGPRPTLSVSAGRLRVDSTYGAMRVQGSDVIAQARLAFPAMTHRVGNVELHVGLQHGWVEGVNVSGIFGGLAVRRLWDL